MICDRCSKPISRTEAQNSYWWKVMSILGNEWGYDKDEMSILIKEHFGWYRIFVNKKTGEEKIIHESSADWNKVDFAEHTDRVIRFAAENGIVIMTPEEFYNQN